MKINNLEEFSLKLNKQLEFINLHIGKKTKVSGWITKNEAKV